MTATRHTLAEWLALHELDAPSCRKLLNEGAARCRAEATEPDRSADLEIEALDLADAWDFVHDAMCAFFPAQRHAIAAAFETVDRLRLDARETTRRGLTLNDGGVPKIFYIFEGKPSDLLVMGHEFAHALQLVQRRERFMPPMMREVCAFIGEHAVLRHADAADAALAGALLSRMKQDTRKYVLSDGKKLLSSLDDLTAPYRYAWNYPIARYLADRIATGSATGWIWKMFEGQLSVRQILL